MTKLGLPWWFRGKVSACNVGNLGLIPGSGRSTGEGNHNPLPYSCLENPMDRETWWATVHGVTKSWTRLTDFTYLLMNKLMSMHLKTEEIQKFFKNITY